jgi:hypothetical protein
VFSGCGWRVVDKGWSSSLGDVCGANNSSPQKNKLVTKCHIGSRTSTDSLDERPKLRKMDTCVAT